MGQLQNRFIQHSVNTVAVLLLVLMTGCDSDKDLIANAKMHLAKSDNKAAIIELKSALQKSPAQGEARYLLGSTLLLEGDLVAAEVELRKALDAKYSADSVVPLLARAMLSQGQAKKVVDEFGSRRFENPPAQASLQTTLASAYSALGQTDQSRVALTAALAADNQYVPALLLSARQKATVRDVDGALALIDGVIGRSPANAEALNLKGDILQYARDRPVEAEAAYRDAIKADPKLLPPQFSLITVLMRQAKLDDAGKALERLKQIAAQNPQTKFFEAQLAYYKEDFKSARDLVQQLLRLAPKNAYLLQLAGAVEFRLGSWAQAEAFLTRATLVAPDLPLARRLLIANYLRSGQSRKALKALEFALSKGDVDPALYPIAGEIFLQNDDMKKAEEYFVKALKVDPDDAGRRSALAMLRISSGRVSEGLGELKDVSDADKSVTADLALISVYFRRSEFDKALVAIDKLEAKQPAKPTAANLRGRVLLSMKDAEGARKSFERAVAIDSNFFPAVASLANLDLAEKKPEVAKKRFEALLTKDPKNVQALLALAQVADRNRAGKDEVSALLIRAVDADPTDLGARQALIDLLLRYRDTKQALIVAQNGVSMLPASLEMLFVLGRVQQLSGELNQAVSIYSKLIALQPLAKNPYLRLAEVQVASRNSEAARQSLRKALEVSPGDLEVQRAMVALDLGAKRYVEARKTATSVQAQRPKAPEGFVLEGDIANVQRDWVAAASAYRAALLRSDAPTIATKLHAVLLVAGRAAEADLFVSTWLKDHPRDTFMLVYLGELALSRKDYSAAEGRYQTVLQRNPDNAIVLNNLAWVTGQLGKDGAVDYAEKANRLAPNQPMLMDTLATLLADKKEFSKAIDIQTKALGFQPSNAGLRLNMAKIYIKSGDKARAKAELETLLKQGDNLASRSEVAALLKSL